MITVSIVSHGHGDMVIALIEQLKKFPLVSQIILTLNIPEYLEIDKSDETLNIVNNQVPLGFGHNHNNAFRFCKKTFFCILNPDISFSEDPFPELVNVLHDNRIALVAPLMYSVSGLIEDNARVFPTSLNITKKFFLGKENRWPLDSKNYLYLPDWVAGMFMLIHAYRFKEYGGFDTRFFMYYEDVDLCRRIRQKGLEVALLKSVSVIHSARRDSRKKFRFFLWHLHSLFRYLFVVK